MLDSSDWSLVSRSFERFYNLGESQDSFDFDNCMYQTKEDGSLINLYYWNDQFRINTRGSFGDGFIHDSGRTWANVFKEAFPLYYELDKKYTYAFELCSPYNQVVRFYDRPTVFCLSVFDGEIELPFDHEIYDQIRNLGANIVKTQHFSSCEMAVEFLKRQEKDDPTFEGFVLRDKDNNRIKAKNLSWVNLHHLHDNGNVASPKRLIPLIMNSEIDEVLFHFDYLRPEVDKWKKIIDDEWKNVDNLWFCYWDAKSDKAFAQAIVGKTKFTDCLFRARKNKTHPKDYFNSETVVKVFK